MIQPAKKLHLKGLPLYKADHFDEAVQTWEEGYQRCGPGYSFLSLQALNLSRTADFEGAADFLIRELHEPFPNQVSVAMLAVIYPGLSAGKQSEIRKLGITAEDPLIVPSVAAEYQWIGMLCGKKVPVSQALVSGANGNLDRMEFSCTSQENYVLYFDYSADPMERMLMQQLQLQK